MEILLKQRFQFSIIGLVKNYSVISHKKPDPIINEDSIFLESMGHRFRLPSKEHRNKVYFHSDDPNGENLNFQPCKLNGANAFMTMDDDKLKKYYGNPFADISIQTLERKVTLNGDNLTLKFYKHTKRRENNWKFFSKVSSSKSITINLVTGNITTIECSYGKSGKQTIRKNSFSDASTIIHHIMRQGDEINSDTVTNMGIGLVVFPNNKLGKLKRSEIRKKYAQEFNTDQVYLTLFKAMKVNTDDIFGVTRNTLLFDALIKLFVRAKKIKVPNNYFNLLINWYPTMKFLKKNDNKLVAAILDRFNLKSKYLIKLLHENPSIDVFFLVRLCWFFGSDFSKYIPKINTSLFSDEYVIKETNSLFIDGTEKGLLFQYIKNNTKPRQIFSDIEKSRAVKYFNCVENKFIKKHVLISDFDDHLKMLEQMRDFYPDRVMKATTVEGFKDEHLELTKFSLMIRRGESIEYVFNEKLVNEIEREINVTVFVSNFDMKNYKFMPVILKKEEEYIEEGTHMHHCVASYIDKDTSLIISLRLDSKHNSERVTCEYNTYSANCVQARYFCNGQPPAYFNDALIELENRIKKSKHILKPIDKKINTLVINGIDVSKTNQNILEQLANNYGYMPLPF